jgi:adenylate kinase family enzyme
MLYIISGVSRAGKSTLSRMILEEYKIPYMSLDFLYMGYQNAFPDIHIEDEIKSDFKRAEIMWPFVRAVCENAIFAEEKYLIEGVFISPKSIKWLQDKYPGKVRACCIGYREKRIEEKREEIKKYDCPNNWLKNSTDDFIEHVVKTSKGLSHLTYEECKKYGIKYFDTSSDFLGTLDLAKKYLVEY